MDATDKELHCPCSRQIPSYNCTTCGLTTDFKVILNSYGHTVGLSPPKTKVCQKCHQFYTHSTLLLLGHLAKCNGAPVCYLKSKSSFVIRHLSFYSCPLCPFNSRRKDSLKVHVLEHKSEKLKCERCDSSVSLKHVRVNYNVAWFRCKQCCFKTKVHPKHDLQCFYCPYRTTQKRNLQKHVFLKHTDEDSIRWKQCEFCKYRTKQQCHLTNHIRVKHSTHRESDYYKCEFCPFKSVMKSTLKKHVAAKHLPRNDTLIEEKWFQCEVCPFQSRHKQHFHNHVISKHRSDKFQWLECEQCSYRTKVKAYLNKHVRLQHTVCKLWKCEFCDFKVKQRCHLKEHVICRHTDRAELQMLNCKQCDYTTYLPNTMRSHVRNTHRH